jgi:energy-coupling factor transport system permease protein
VSLAVADPRADSGIDLQAPIARTNPVAKLAASSIIALGLLISVDVVTAGVALTLEALALPWSGVRPRALLRRGVVVILGAVPAGVATAVFGEDSGSVLAALGPVSITTGSALAGVAITMRIFAIGLPGVVLLSTTDPTDLADALAQVARLPARFTLAALASLRLFGLMAAEWRSLSLARRARGIGDAGPIGTLRTAMGQVFALLVLAIRRATVLATAMEARGFGAGRERTWARESRLHVRDGLLVLGAAALTALAVTSGVRAGTWNPVLG